MFATLVNGMVELSADLLEEIGTELDSISRAVFPKRKKPTLVASIYGMNFKNMPELS
jgi:Mg2+ and Co2+ transporter CorA